MTLRSLTLRLPERSSATLLVLICWIAQVGLVWLPEQGFPTRYLPFFHLQANSFLEGRTSLALPQGWTHDVITTSQGSFLALAPLGGLLVLPFVGLFGTGFPETLYSLLLSLGFLLTLWLFIEHFGSLRRSSERMVVFVATALGTPAFFAAVNGTAWFTASLAGCTFLLAGTLVIDRSDGSGTKTGGLFLVMLAALSRLNLAPIVPLLGIYLWIKSSPRSFRELAMFLSPTIILLILIGFWNWLRFGDVLSLNYGLHGYGAHFESDIINHGMTSFRYVLPHLYYGLFGAPRLVTEFPFFETDPNGNGFFALSPLYLFAFLRPEVESPRFRFALVSLIAVAIPIMTHFSTGWSQFGYRYILDGLPFLLILLLDTRAKLNGTWATLAVILSLYINALGIVMHLDIWKP